MSQSSIPTIEVYWSLVDKADKKFSRVRDLPNYGRSRSDADFQKVFKVYTQLWKFQQENRQKLVESGLKRWEIGEIASRIAQLYYGQYLRTSDATFLSESYIFYEAILTREYFREGLSQDLNLANKQLRFLARFLVVCLVLNRREMVHQLVNQLRMTLDECKTNFPEANFKDWKRLVQEILKFLKADTAFMNRRPLRYTFSLDPDPDYIQTLACPVTRRLKLREAILCSYHHNEIKFAELTLDSFRMHQCLEWEPSGSFYQTKGTEVSGIGMNNGQSAEVVGRFPQLLGMTDPSLPPNPRKAVLYRPVVTHFLAILATICEELPSDGILLIYLSGSGIGGNPQHLSASGTSRNDIIYLTEDFHSVSIASDVPSSSPMSCHDSPDHSSCQSNSNGLWLCSPGNGGVNCLYACDLIPFTRRPLFLIIDSESSRAFKAVSGTEIGEKVAILLSPSSPTPAAATGNGAHHPTGSQFTMFLTAPLQAFCLLLGFSGSEIETDTYNKADELLSASFTEWGLMLATSDSVHPVWAQVLHDPFLRRLLLRFIFCRDVLALYAPTFNKKEFSAECVPDLPESVLPTSITSQSRIFELANIFGHAHRFIFSFGNMSAESRSSEPDITHIPQ